MRLQLSPMIYCTCRLAASACRAAWRRTLPVISPGLDGKVPMITGYDQIAAPAGSAPAAPRPRGGRAPPSMLSERASTRFMETKVSRRLQVDGQLPPHRIFELVPHYLPESYSCGGPRLVLHTCRLNASSRRAVSSRRSSPAASRASDTSDGRAARPPVERRPSLGRASKAAASGAQPHTSIRSIC